MTTSQIIGLVIVLLLAIVCGFFICRKSKKYSLAKWTLLFLIVSLLLTWIFGASRYQEGQILEYGMMEQGISDIPNMIYQAIYLAGDKIIFLLMLGAFYAVLGRSEGYKKFVGRIAEKIKGREVTFALISSFIITLMTALFTQTFIVLVFVPFIISVLLSAKLDKITAFSATFGSIMVGLMGVIYGSEGVYWFNYYAQTNYSLGILYRIIILVVAFLLLNVFMIIHANKVLKDNKREVEEDPFAVQKFDSKAKRWPVVVVLIITLVLIILGYVDWAANWKITAFTNFHNWLIGLKVGKATIFKTILGASSAEFGTWNLFHGTVLLMFMSLIIALISNIKLNELFDAYLDGFKKMLKPLVVFTIAYMIMIIAYLCPYVPTITNLIFKGASAFNPFLVSLGAIISHIFHIDLGYTGFAIGQYFVTNYPQNVELIYIIFLSLYGLVGFIVPTQAILLIGLEYLGLEYKTWMKYIWMFVVIIILVLIILFTVLTYLV